MKFYGNIGKLQQLQVIMTSINIVQGSKFTFLASVASKFVSDCFQFCLFSIPQLINRLYKGNQTCTKTEVIILKPICLYRSSPPEPFLTKGQICGGNYTWKIENFSQLLQGDSDGIKTSLDSPPIYTSLDEYKFFMRIYPKGDDGGDGSHIGLFVGMMKGNCDNRLTWPFCGRISLSMLDQSNDAHRSCDDVSGTFMANRNLAAFQKPSPRGQYTTLYGYEKFVPIDTVRRPQYLKDDAVMINIEIHKHF